MRTRAPQWILLPGTVGAALLLSMPASGRGALQFGGGLGVGVGGSGYQRDVRIFNNAADPTANTNATPELAHPGALGAALAVWKAARAWDSDTPEAAKNFDFDWQGATTAVGGVDDNVVSWIPSCAGGTLAFTSAPTGDGWSIRLCDNWTWSDAPSGPPPGAIDIQSVVVHQLGIALGVLNPTSTGHTITPADSAMLGLIYGSIPANKPTITHLSGGTAPGQTLVVHGQNFAPFVAVKFTADTSQDAPPIPGVLFNVPTTGGGQMATVTVPPEAAPGNVLIWEPSVSLLSNPFPIDTLGVPMPAVAAPAQSSGGSQVIWNFSGAGGHAWFLIVAINDPTTIPFAGESYLLNAQLLFTGTFPPLGTATQTAFVPVGVGPFTFYSQVVTLGGAPTPVVHASNVTTTQNLF